MSNTLKELINLKVKSKFDELEFILPEIKKMSENQKGIIKSSLRLSYLDGRIDGISFGK
jgi:hypothetical protein